MATYAFNKEAKKEIKASGRGLRDFFELIKSDTITNAFRSAWIAACAPSRGVERETIVVFIDEINRRKIPIVGEPRCLHLEFAKHTAETKQNTVAASRRQRDEETSEDGESMDSAADGQGPNQSKSSDGDVAETDGDSPASCESQSAEEASGSEADSSGHDGQLFFPIAMPRRSQRHVIPSRIAFLLICASLLLLSSTVWFGFRNQHNPVLSMQTNPVGSDSQMDSLPAVLAGSVIDSATNQPISGVELTLVDIDSDEGETPVCMTDAHGRFRFRDLPVVQERQVEMVANKSGYEVSRNHVWLGTNHFQ